MENPNSNQSEDTLINDYLLECEKLFKSKFNAKKTREFTKKYLDRQLHGPQIPDFEPAKLESLRKMSALEVQAKILSGESTLAQIVQQYHKIKADHNNANNFLTWSRFKEPFERAQQIDDEIRRLGPEKALEKYPLLGFVFSLKDTYYLKDSPTTGGIALNLDRVASEDPDSVRMLKNKGALITCKGNVPQMLFAFETNNNLYGEATLYQDQTRSVGGSTGGDSGMVAYGYVNCAMGSDVGGSVRIPILFNGLCSIKSTSGRLSFQCHARFLSRSWGSDRLRSQPVKSKYDVQHVIPVSLGPLAKRVEDLEPILKVLLEDQSFDSKIAPLPWRPAVSFAKRVGVYRENSLMELGPTAKRMIDEGLDALRKANYEIVELDLEDIMSEIIMASTIAYNKNLALFNIVTGKTDIGEKLGDIFSLAKLVHSLPLWVVRIAKWKEGESRKGYILDKFLKSKEISSQDLFEIRAKCYRQFEQKMKEQNVSAIISTGLPIPAIKRGISNKCLLAVSYLFFGSFLDIPSGVLPIGTVREDEQFYESRHDDEMTQILKENALNSAGLPMGISVSARAFQEEVVYQVMKDIQNNLG